MQYLSQKIINLFGTTDKVLHFTVASLINALTMLLLILLFPVLLSKLFLALLIGNLTTLAFIFLKEFLDCGWNINKPTFDKKDILFGCYGMLFVDILVIIAVIL